MSVYQYQGILVEDRAKLRIITFNRPARKNAWEMATAQEITRALREANDSPKISTVALTGSGDFYSSGNDMKSMMEMSMNNDPDQVLKESEIILSELVETFICFEKLLIAVVNGPCIGIAATTVALCDVVYATKNAYFHTPFTALALCAEACSSVTFPRILGTTKAAELLLLSEKMSAEEALRYNFVSRVFKDQFEVNRILWPMIQNYSELSMSSLMTTKKLVRRVDTEELRAANKREMIALDERKRSGEVAEAAMKFLTRKNKL